MKDIPSRSPNQEVETLKIPSSVSYETKLKFVEIVRIPVSDLATDLAILGVIMFSIYSVSVLKKSIIYGGNVYNKNIKIITLIIVLPGSTCLRSNETGHHLF